MRRCFDARITGVLDMSANGLTSLPSEITDLTNLTYLKLDKNRLMSFPPEIGKLQSLTELSANGNKLISLPSEFGQLVNLQQLRIDVEDLRSPPEEVVNGGTASIMGYLSYVHASHKDKKLMLEGFGLKYVPPDIGELGDLPNLVELVFDTSELRSPPPEVW